MNISGSPVQAVRSGIRHGRDLRLVLDVSGRVATKSFVLQPSSDNKGYRLVVDLLQGGAGACRRQHRRRKRHRWSMPLLLHPHPRVAQSTRRSWWRPTLLLSRTFAMWWLPSMPGMAALIPVPMAPVG